MNIHDGHRQRTKKKFLEHGLDSFSDHEVLELLLFYALPRGDTNPTAHALIDRFGSLAAVLDAPLEELVRVPGIGEGAAALLKLAPQVGRRYLMSRASVGDILYSTQAAGKYIVPLFAGETEEAVYAVCLDGKYKVLGCRLLFRGSVNSAGVSVRRIVEAAISCNATSVILAHNHTSGPALPSEDDIKTTRRVRQALKAVDIELADHLIVADDDFVSLADSGFFD